MLRKAKVAFIIFSLAAGAFHARAQGPVGTINGTILDSAGAVVPGAAVVAVENSTRVETTATTTSAGAYTLPYLPPGTYTLRVSSPGFRTATADNVTLRAAQTLTVNITLEVGQVNEQVTVSAEPPVLESGTAEMGQYINQQEFKSWPIFTSDGQRQIQEFIFDSLPGTTGSTFQGSINGGQQYSHEILIEGLPLGRADLSGGNNNEMSPSLDAIGDFKLQTGAVGAEYNGGQTAVANFAIKSGTNELHGTGFEYLNNEAFNSSSLDTTTLGEQKARYRDNNWGFAIGGPVWIPKLYNGKNKTFFFANFEHDYRNQLGFNGFTTLSPQEYRTGDFSKELNPGWTGQTQAGTQIGTDALGNPVLFGAIYDPASTQTVNGQVVRTPFPNNIIPTNRINPVASNIINNVGLVNPQFDTAFRNTPALNNGQPFFHEHIIGIKIDHNITDKERFSAYYNQGYRGRNNVGGGAYLPVPGPPTTGWQDQFTPSRMVRASLTSTITPTLINRLAAGFNRFLNANGAPLYELNQNWADKIGITNTSSTVFPLFNFSGADWQGGTIDKIGVGSYGASANGSWIINDDVTKIHGKHTFHFGYQYTRYYYNERNFSDSGVYNFSPVQTDLPGFEAQTGNAYASFLLGAASSASHYITDLSDAVRAPYHAAWFHDDWKVTPRLTLNLGLRWEIITPFYETTNRFSYIDLSQPDPAAGNRPGTLVFKNRPSNTYWGELGPRLGIAYQVSNKMVVRGGYAILNTPPITNGWGYGGFTTGYNATITVAKGTSPTGFADDPAIYLNQPFPGLGYSLPNTNPAAANFVANTTTAPDANRPGYTQNWNFSIQYELPKQTLIEVAYVGNKGTRLWGFNALDVLPASRLSMGDTLLNPVSSNPQYIPYSGFPTSLPVSQALLPYPQYYAVNEAYPYNSNSNYTSLQVTATKHLTKDLGFLAAFTWSKTIDYQDSNGAMGYGVPQDYYNRALERSVAGFNVPISVKLTWSYALPFGKGKKFDLHWANPVLGGWNLTGLQSYQSGLPIIVYQSGLNMPPGFGSIRPDVINSNVSLGGVPTAVDYSVPTQWINPAAFASVPMTGNGVPLRVGTAPRTLPYLTNPRSMNETFRLAKEFPFLNERFHFRVGATAMNPFKRRYAYVVDTTVGDSAFGQVLQDGAFRQVQIDARIEF
ncbi:MAG: carboxypeptidase regulatory-like domain-containing protein [Bryobacteraceae bacterium]